VIAVADQLAAAADLARDKTSRVPVVVIEGAGRWRTPDDGPGAAAQLQRRRDEDLFR
jgi:coenzyme F420-0:L-glutamate ligase/coenzyme F420-1:gamma-L-glutamate ligase